MNENVKRLLNEQLLVKYAGTIEKLKEIESAARAFNELVSSAKSEIATIKGIAQTLGISEDEQIKTQSISMMYAPIAELEKTLEPSMKGELCAYHKLWIYIRTDGEEKHAKEGE